jgi:predicted O-methyltransferase YrrM
MKTLIAFFLKPFLSRYHDLKKRILDLEIMVNVLVLDTEWIDDNTKYLNGQIKRQEIFYNIISKFNIIEIIETGTFIGRTTGFFANSLPKAIIKTCELSPQFNELAKRRLSNFNNIKFSCIDSRLFLNNLENNFTYSNDEVTFIYLDAHWHSDLPLSEELEILSKKRNNSIIMIDDFQVLKDDGYMYDDYGVGKRLVFSDYNSIFNKLNFYTYSPTANSANETGRKRGCVVLTQSINIANKLNQISTLKPLF